MGLQSYDRSSIIVCRIILLKETERDINAQDMSRPSHIQCNYPAMFSGLPGASKIRRIY